jgi:hypothetical protein
MDLLSYITGNKQPAGMSLSTSLMDRFMNPMTMAGLAMIGGKDPAAAANFADQFQTRAMNRQMASFLVQNAPAEERAMALLAPQQYVAAKMNRMMDKPFAVSDNQQVYDPASNSWMSPPGSQGPAIWTPDKMRKEYDYSKYTPESVDEAEAARDPSKLVFNNMNPETQKERIQMFNTGRGDIESRLAPIRQGIQSIQLGERLLNSGGGAADYGALVSFVKATDPGTAAREGEVTAAQQAAGYLATIQGIGEKMQAQGGFMGPEQKKAMKEALDGMRSIYADNYKFVNEYAGNYSKEFGLNSQLLMGPTINFGGTEFKPKAAPPIVDSAPDLAHKVKDAILGPSDAPSADAPIMARPKQGGGFEYSYDSGKNWGARK